MAQNVSAETLYFTAATYDDAQRMRVPSGFSSRFGRSENGGITERVNNTLELSMDIVRNRGSIRALTERDFAPAGDNIGQNLLTNVGTKFENVSYPFPMIRGKASVNRDSILKFREPGELAITMDAGSDEGIVNRAGKKLLKLVAQEQNAIAPRIEVMASESIRTGKITLDDSTVAYDFGRAATNTDTPGTVWTDAASLPLNDLTNHREVIDDNGRGDAEAVIMGTDGWAAFIQNPQVTGAADIRNIQFLQAGDPAFKTQPRANFVSELEAAGFDYMAYFRDFRGKKHYIFVYSAKYDVNSTTRAEVMPPKDVLLMDPTMRLDRFFGPRMDWGIITPEKQFVMAQFGISAMGSNNMIADVPNGVFESWMFHHDVNTSKTSISDEIYTSPIYACTEVDLAGTLTDVVA